MGALLVFVFVIVSVFVLVYVYGDICKHLISIRLFAFATNEDGSGYLLDFALVCWHLPQFRSFRYFFPSSGAV